MKLFNPLSFFLGLSSGFLVFVLVFGAMRIFGDPAPEGFPENGGNLRQMREANGGSPNTAMLAERFGMTEAELQAELDSGKTIRQIEEERGIELPMGRGMQRGNGTGSAFGSGEAALGSGGLRLPVGTASGASINRP